MELIDTHAHLYSEEFETDIDLVIQRAADAGVSKILLPNVDTTSIQVLTALTVKHPDKCLPMMGLHPCSVKADYREMLNTIEITLRKGNYIAVGEIGLDYYWDVTFKAEQQDAFKTQIGWAKSLNLPIAIHTRNSFDDAVEILQSHKDEKLSGVFHCFTGTAEDAKKVTGLGFYLGIGGVVTFKNSGLAQVLEKIDLEYIVLETDAPYLAPVPHRGKRNESAYTRLVAEKVAQAKSVSLEKVAEITSRNARKLFGF